MKKQTNADDMPENPFSWVQQELCTLHAGYAELAGHLGMGQDRVRDICTLQAPPPCGEEIFNEKMRDAIRLIGDARQIFSKQI
jgi:hypothetical protein